MAGWMSRVIACMFGISSEEFVERGPEYVDISRLMSLLTTEEINIDCPYSGTSSGEFLAGLEDEEPAAYRELQPRLLPELQDGEPLDPKRVEQHVPFAGMPESVPVPVLPEVAVTGRGKDATLTREVVWTAEEMFKEVHGGRKMHWGARRTWQGWNKCFPWHNIPFRFIQDKIEECVVRR